MNRANNPIEIRISLSDPIFAITLVVIRSTRSIFGLSFSMFSFYASDIVNILPVEFLGLGYLMSSS